MNTIIKTLLPILLLTISVFPQTTSVSRHPESGIQYPDTSIKHPDSSIQHPDLSGKVERSETKRDYRNHLNIPEYDPSLMPLKSVRTGTGVWKELNPKVPRVDYLCVEFWGNDTGWACGANGALIKSTNAGKNWHTIQSNSQTVLLNINTYDGKVVIVTGYTGTLLRSTDGGESFENIQSGVGVDLWSIKMLDDTLGWICGLNSTLLKTTDGGTNWQQINTGYNGFHYWGLYFINKSIGYIACGNGKILRTQDGGLSWELINVGENIQLYTITVFDTSNFIVAGQRDGTLGRVAYTTDGGNTYNYSNAGYLVESMSFANDTLGYAVGSELVLYRTTNKGRNWEYLAYRDVGEYWIKFFNDSTAYQAGRALRINKTTDKGYTWNKVIVNDDFYDVYFISETEGFALSFFSLYKTTDGGITWKKNNNCPGGYDIQYLDSLTGFIGGSQTMYKTTDGGNSWYQPNGIPGGISKIFFINYNIGWAIHGRNILKTIDNGENWFTQITLPAENYTSIYFIDSLNGWATSRYIWQTTNGGNNWIQRTDVPAFFCDDVFFSDYFRGWIIAGNELYSTSNGGNSWTLDPQIYTYSRNFETISNTHFIITGTNIYESTDTGHVWQNITSITGGYFTSLHAPKDYIAYAVGTGGFIVRYFDSLIVPVELSQFYADLKENMSVQLQWVTESEINNLGFEILRSVDLFNWNKIAFVTGIGTSTSKFKYTFNDNNFSGSKVYYRLKQLDYNGHYSLSKIVAVEFYVKDYYLYQNYPNPANPSTCITFTLPQSVRTKIELFTVTGEKVREILDDEKEKGIYKININLNDFSSGVYFYAMRTNSGYSAIKKLILIK
jgi:photosystem II stability/assembly factor-like uncharacterized protein